MDFTVPADHIAQEGEKLEKYLQKTWKCWFGLVWFGGFYGISTFVGYLTPNPFLCT